MRGFYTDVSDYWRFIVTEDGYFVFFTRSGSPVVRVLDLVTGAEKWSRALTNFFERPLFAANGGYLYIIGRAQQFKVNINTGAVVWQTSNAFNGDTGYIHENFEGTTNSTNEPVYRPMALTDSTLWFVDGDRADVGKLVGLNTSNGAIVANIDLAAQVRSGTVSLDLVNDLIAADGKLGVLMTLRDSADPNPLKNPKQDLYVYDFGGATLLSPPPPPTPSTGELRGRICKDDNGQWYL